MNEHSKYGRIPWWMWMALALVVLTPVAYMGRLFIAEQIWGGPHVILSGESYGFQIGMTKAEVFEKYRLLRETVNISCSGPSPDDGDLILDIAELKFNRAFQASDHWMAFRRKAPVVHQEFFFSSGKLTKIITYIRYYEVP